MSTKRQPTEKITWDEANQKWPQLEIVEIDFEETYMPVVAPPSFTPWSPLKETPQA